MTKPVKSLTETMPTSVGDVEATKTPFKDEPWEINHPWGSEQFYGTRAEVRARMRQIIALQDEDES